MSFNKLHTLRPLVNNDTQWKDLTLKEQGVHVAKVFKDLKTVNKGTSKYLHKIQSLDFNLNDMFQLPKKIMDKLDVLGACYVAYLIMMSLLMAFGVHYDAPRIYFLDKKDLIHLYHHALMFLLHAVGKLRNMLCSNGQCVHNNRYYWDFNVCII